MKNHMKFMLNTYLLILFRSMINDIVKIRFNNVRMIILCVKVDSKFLWIKIQWKTMEMNFN